MKNNNSKNLPGCTIVGLSDCDPVSGGQVVHLHQVTEDRPGRETTLSYFGSGFVFCKYKYWPGRETHCLILDLVLFFANTNTGLAEKYIVSMDLVLFFCLPSTVNSWSLPIQVDGVSDTAPTGFVALRDNDDKTCRSERQ